jgi:hypothetical protein
MTKSERAINDLLGKLECLLDRILDILWGKKLGLDEMDE